MSYSFDQPSLGSIMKDIIREEQFRYTPYADKYYEEKSKYDFFKLPYEDDNESIEYVSFYTQEFPSTTEKSEDDSDEEHGSSEDHESKEMNSEIMTNEVFKDQYYY